MSRIIRDNVKEVHLKENNNNYYETFGFAVTKRFFLHVILFSHKQAIKVLMFVVGLFAVCWLPLQTYQVTSVLFSAINK